jgi:hypothetical protein
MGLEPTSGGTTIHCLNHLATLAMEIIFLSFVSVTQSQKKDQGFLPEIR